MNCIEHIENKEETAYKDDEAQDNILSATDSPVHVIKSFSTQQAADALSVAFFDEAVCRQWVLQALHPNGAFCPHCRAALKNESGVKFWNMQYTTCHACGKRFLATKGTVLHNTTLSMRQAFALACFIELGLSNKRIASIIGIHPDSVRLWRLKLDSR